jgi:hypothetical protein
LSGRNRTFFDLGGKRFTRHFGTTYPSYPPSKKDKGEKGGSPDFAMFFFPAFKEGQRGYVQSSKRDIYKELKGKSGIYLFINKITNDLYNTFSHALRLSNYEKSFSTQTHRVSPNNGNFALDPFFITGFCDGESSFMVHVESRGLNNYQIITSFSITLHEKDSLLLKNIQSFFGSIGKIYYIGSTAIFRVTKHSDIVNRLIPHFNSYPLLTKKSADFVL